MQKLDQLVYDLDMKTRNRTLHSLDLHILESAILYENIDLEMDEPMRLSDLLQQWLHSDIIFDPIVLIGTRSLRGETENLICTLLKNAKYTSVRMAALEAIDDHPMTGELKVAVTHSAVRENQIEAAYAIQIMLNWHIEKGIKAVEECADALKFWIGNERDSKMVDQAVKLIKASLSPRKEPK